LFSNRCQDHMNFEVPNCIDCQKKLGKNLIKYGKLFLLSMTIIELILILSVKTGLMDVNGLIGASIINLSCQAGIAIAFINRGRSELRLNRGTLPKGD